MEMTSVSAPYRFFFTHLRRRHNHETARLLQVDITRAHINRDINFTR